MLLWNLANFHTCEYFFVESGKKRSKRSLLKSKHFLCNLFLFLLLKARLHRGFLSRRSCIKFRSCSKLLRYRGDFIAAMLLACKLMAISWRFYRRDIAGDFMQLRRDKNCIELRDKNRLCKRALTGATNPNSSSLFRCKNPLVKNPPHWPCSKRAGDWVRTYFFLVWTFNIDWIENGARHLKEHPKISKFTKFNGYWFKCKGMVHF